MANLNVIQPGLYSTIQDKGRCGFRQFGVPTSGVMDDLAFETANALLDNNSSDAVIEMTLSGGTFVFDEDTFIAVTGADMNPTLNGNQDLLMWRTVKINKGDVIAFKTAVKGCRTYLAIKGGFQLPMVMESRSTYTRAKIGKSALKRGDILPYLCHEGEVKRQIVCDSERPIYDHEATVRVVLGPHDEAFTKKGIDTFLNEPYTVSNTSDRMGYRLKGPIIEHQTHADILSDGIVRGAIQVPGHGEPIVLLSDCQTSGGYTKIAHVITPDLWKIAQLKPGDCIRFENIDIQAAQNIKPKALKSMVIEVKKMYQIKVHSRTYDVQVDFLRESEK